MSLRSLKLYGTAGATANAVAQVTIPSASTLKAVQYAVGVDMVADNSILGLELSKVPTSQIGVNGAQDPFLELRAYGNLVTSGFPIGGLNGMVPINVPCRQGEIIYLHCLITTCTFYGEFIIWF